MLRKAVLSFIILFSFPAYGQESDLLHKMLSIQATTSSTLVTPTILALQATTSGVLTSSGSTYDQHSVSIPTGALAGDETIVIRPPDDTDFGGLTEWVNVPSSVVFEIQGEASYTFQEPVSLSIQFLDQEISDNRDNMRIHFWDAAINGWKRIMSPHTIPDTTNVLTADVTHFTAFGAKEVVDTMSVGSITPSVWNMIGVPVETEGNSDPEIVFGDNMAEFQAVVDNSVIYEYNEVSGAWEIPRVIQYGSGYIFFSWYDADTLDIDGLQITGDITQYLTVTGGNGWHLLANPYSVSSDWGTDITIDADIDNNFYEWDGTQYVFYPGGGIPSATIPAWQGFWVHANADSAQIDFSYSGTGAAKRSAPVDNSIIPRIKITAESGTTRDIYNFIGVKEGASHTHDPYDVYELTPLGLEYTSLFFEAGENRYTQDIRPVEDMLQFDMVIATNSSAGSVTLDWDIPADYSDYSVTLVDSSSKRTDMRSVDSVTVTYAPGLIKSTKSQLNMNVNPTDILSKISSDGTTELRFKVLLEKTATGVEEIPVTVQEYYLKQNYPNPFNPETTIEFGIPKLGRVKLQIFNMLGQEVVTLIDEQRSAGVHRKRWDGSNSSGHPVATGIYLYRIVSGGYVHTKKMVLIR